MKLRIKNFRSLKDTGDIEIKPITVLIGKNSSGKSSFLRTFPMLKQSVQERTTSPILLYGDYVDLGSYKDIKPHFQSEKTNELYELSFTLENRNLYNSTPSYFYDRNNQRFNTDKNFEILYSLKFNENKKELIQIHNIYFEVLNNSINLRLNQENKSIKDIYVNNVKLFDKEDNLKFVDEGEFNVDIWIENKISDKKQNNQRFKNLIEDKTIDVISKHLRKGTSFNTKSRIISKIKFNEDFELLQDIKNVTISKIWTNKTNSWTINSPEFIELKNHLLMNEFFNFFFIGINFYLKNLFLNLNYIAPLRATAERYYRIQQLAVNEVDQNGKNLPIFLGSLSDTQLIDFQNWTFDNFGFKTKISKIEGHYSIKIELEDDYEINLSDMGFGYSQILPILTQIWYSTSKYRFKKASQGFFNRTRLDKILVIEQPELHLHPEFQAKFADSIAKVITYCKESNIPFKIILETHSDIIVNRFGDNILNKKISHNDINIIVFNKESEKSPTEISISYYDDEGNLINWPTGFFQPSIL